MIGPASADEIFGRTSSIAVPGGLGSFDISFVDPQLGLYFLADRTNKTVDQVVTGTNQITQLAKGAFVGVQSGSNTAGPNGVITAKNSTEVWAGDGVLCGGGNNNCGASTPATQTSLVKVISLSTGAVTHTIDTKGQRRADELCEDPQHHVVLVANDDALDLFITFISTDSYSVIGTIKFDGTDPNGNNIKSTNGIEQCQWSPRTQKFYLNIPQVGGTPGADDTPGVVVQISPTTLKVEKVFPIDFGGACLGPQGMAIGPEQQILLGCHAGGSVIINELDGSLIAKLPGLDGNDEVWYNPGDNHYFLAGSNHTGGPILGVVDALALRGDSTDPNSIVDASATTLAGSHSVAADPVHNQVYVPINAGSAALCGETATGCIAVFSATGDDPGLCVVAGAPILIIDNDELVFLKTVCPSNLGPQADR